MESNTHQVTIKSLSDLGEGVAHLEENIYIPFVLPEEKVEISLRKRKKKKRQGELLAILSTAQDRREPLCSHFGVCGGCQVQHLHYSSQLQWKEEMVKAKFSFLCPVPMQPIVPSPKEWGWRNKMEFSFSSDLKGEKFLGLMMREGRGKVFHMEECPLSPPWYQDSIQKLRTFWEKSGLEAYRHFKNSGHLRQLTVRYGHRTEDKMVLITVSGNPDYALKKEHMNQLKELFPEEVSLFLIVHQIIKGSPTQFFEIHLQGPTHIRETLYFEGQELKFKISPRAFFQPNPFTAEQIYTKAINSLELTGEEVVYDLFCGTAPLSIFASKKAKKVIGIELSKEACLDAEENARLNGLENIQIIQGDVGAVLKRGDLPNADCVIVDPPRCGLNEEQIEQVISLNSKKLLYVSCNPATLAQNIEILLRFGYTVKFIQPFDQFPQTKHVEVVVLLER